MHGENPRPPGASDYCSWAPTLQSFFFRFFSWTPVTIGRFPPFSFLRLAPLSRHLRLQLAPVAHLCRRSCSPGLRSPARPPPPLPSSSSSCLLRLHLPPSANGLLRLLRLPLIPSSRSRFRTSGGDDSTTPTTTPPRQKALRLSLSGQQHTAFQPVTKVPRRPPPAGPTAAARSIRLFVLLWSSVDPASRRCPTWQRIRQRRAATCPHRACLFLWQIHDNHRRAAQHLPRAQFRSIHVRLVLSEMSALAPMPFSPSPACASAAASYLRSHHFLLRSNFPGQRVEVTLHLQLS